MNDSNMIQNAWIQRTVIKGIPVIEYYVQFQFEVEFQYLGMSLDNAEIIKQGHSLENILEFLNEFSLVSPLNFSI
jgi:hypothetical protein